MSRSAAHDVGGAPHGNGSSLVDELRRDVERGRQPMSLEGRHGVVGEVGGPVVERDDDRTSLVVGRVDPLIASVHRVGGPPGRGARGQFGGRVVEGDHPVVRGEVFQLAFELVDREIDLTVGATTDAVVDQDRDAGRRRE